MSTTAIVRVDPKTLLIGPNVRKETTLRKEFVASVELHGVLVPIIAQESPDGLEVVDGQMRTLAAVDAGLAEVPVFVQPVIADEASRIVEQIVVNEDRAGLTAPDHVAAIAQLALDFKMPAAEVAKRTGATKDQVAAAVKASKSPQATAALGEEGVTLELAAKIAEAGLSKADTERVLASRWNKEHALQQILDERAKLQKITQLERDVKKSGVPLAAKPSTDEHGYSYSSAEKNKHRYLTSLVDKETGEPVRVEEHADCPGHAAWVGVKGYQGSVEVQYLCTDPAKHGHRDKNKAVPKKLTDEERQQRQIEKARADLWPSINTVRVDWVRGVLLPRKTMPAGWEALVIADLTGEYSRAEAWTPWKDTACELLGLSTGDGWDAKTTAIREYARKSVANASRVALGLLVARHEHAIAEAKAKGWATISPAYLRLLATWGYPLSELERELVDAAAVTS